MASNEDRLLAQLNATQLQIKDNPTYQVIKQLIDRLRKLEQSVSVSGDTNTITNITEIIQQFTFGDSGGGDGEVGPPGIKGETGNTGATGPAGPVTLGPMGLDADSPEEPWMIPGVIGPQGNQGPEGSHTLVMLGLDGYDGEDGMPIPGRDGATGSSASWSLIASTVIGGATASYPVTGLSSYSELLVIIRSMTFSANSAINVQVSIDNGATYLTASGDYVSIAGDSGVENNFTAFDLNNGGTTVARSGILHLYGINVTNAPKVGQTSFYSGSLNILTRMAVTNSPITAIKVLGNGGNMTGGSIYVLGR